VFKIISLILISLYFFEKIYKKITINEKIEVRNKNIPTPICANKDSFEIEKVGVTEVYS
jgi:hypothetical protein